MARHLHKAIVLLFVLVPMLIVPSAARAQSPAADSTPRLKLDRPLFITEPLTRTAQPGNGSRDSLTNGVVIGAVIGAVTAGVFGAVVCNALKEPGDPSCATGVLRIAAFGAAIGAGGGLAVDAALSRQSGVRVAVRVRF